MDGPFGPSRLPPEGARPNGRHNPDQIREAMQQLRQEIHRDAQITREDASKIVDWKSHVQSHPFLSVGLAAAAGFLLAPAAKRVVHLTDKQVANLSKKGSLNISNPAETATTAAGVGAISSVLMTLGTFAGRTLLSHAIERLESAYRQRHANGAAVRQPPVNPHEPTFY